MQWLSLQQGLDDHDADRLAIVLAEKTSLDPQAILSLLASLAPLNPSIVCPIVVDAIRGFKEIAGRVFVRICCERLAEPDEGRAFAEVLAALMVRGKRSNS